MRLFIFILITILNFENILAVLPQQSSCGTQTVTPNIVGANLNRIISGSNAISDSWPWQVSLRRKYSFYGQTYISTHFCGGTLIYENYVLTAAHCVDSYTADQLAVIIGISNIETESASASNTYSVSNRYYHESYGSESTTVNDIALLKLSTNVTLGTKIALACLPSSASNTSTVLNKKLVTTGWGSTISSGQNLATQLQETTLTVLNGNSACSGYETSLLYCTLDQTGSSDVCQGDSGGPLVYYDTDKWYVYGVTSFGIWDGVTVCSAQFASFFTRVPDYLNWMEGQIQLSADAVRNSAGANHLKISYFLLINTILLALWSIYF